MQAKKYTDLYAFDLDGTLVHRNSAGEKCIPPYLLETLADLSKSFHLTIATGRRYRAMLSDLSRLPAMPFVIAHNGLVIRDSDGRLVQRKTLELDLAFEVARLIHAHREDYFFVLDGYQDNPDYAFTRHALQAYRSIQLVYERGPEHCLVLDSLEDLRKFRQLPLLEVAILGHPGALIELKERLSPVFPKEIRSFVVRNIGSNGIGAFEVFHRTHSKWTGVSWVKVKLGADRVIAVGDDENDIEMLRYADVGVAMGHADREILEAARYRAEGPEGLNKWLQEFSRIYEKS